MKLQLNNASAALAALALGAGSLLAQGTRADYERAQNLRRLTENKVFKSKVSPHWLADNTRFWYRNDLPGGRREFVLVTVESGRRQPAFDHARLAAALAQATTKDFPADQLPVDRIEFEAGGQGMRFSAEGRRWRCDMSSYALRELPAQTNTSDALPTGITPRASRRTGAETYITFINKTTAPVTLYWLDPQGDRQRYATIKPGESHRQHTFAGHVWLAADLRGDALAVFEAVTEEKEAVIDGTRTPKTAPPDKPKPAKPPGKPSPDGKWTAFLKEHNVQVRRLDTGREFQLSRDGQADDAYSDRFHWSPDSSRLVAIRTRKAEERQVHVIESSPKDQLQPKLHSFAYAKPGDSMPVDQPRLFEVAAEKEIPVSTALFNNPWSLTELRWAPDSRRFTFLYNQRGHQVLRVVTVDARTGAARALVDEQSQTFIDYSGKQFLHYLEESGEIIWMSERDGWNHLYLYDAQSGRVKNQITKGPWVVRKVERVDAPQRQIWFSAGGIRPGQDPYYVHYARVNFDGSGLVVLTEGDGTHTVEYSPDRRYLLDTWSRVDCPPVTELRRAADGRRMCELERADWTALTNSGWRRPEPFAAKGRDGITDIYGVIFQPTHFDPAKKYPVIENVYAGPQSAYVPKAFKAFHSSQEMAELGFAVVQIDGMGTSHRSKAFHDVCWKNLGDSGFPDRILWLKAAAAKYPWMDLSRVGIYGGSAGGQNSTRALLAHGDFYKVAASDCGCHDNRMDKIWWNEQWMGWPMGPHYAEQSNVTQAHQLQGKLLLTVGELDRNVDPASTMQLVNALIKADKDFELLVVPGAGHGIGESPYAKRRRADFFVRHLLGAEPRRD